MKKIFVVSTLLTGHGGMETVLKNFSRLMLEKNIRVKYLFLGRPKKNKHDLSWLDNLDYTILEPRYPFKDFIRKYLETRALARAVEQEKPDALLALNTGAVERLISARKHTFPFDIYSWMHFSLKILRNTSIITKADYHLSISSGISRELTELLNIDPEKVFTVFNPIPFKPTHALIQRPESGPTTFVFVGRLTEQKDPFLLLNAALKLKGNWRILMIGDGPMRSDIQAFIERSPTLKDKVLPVGWQKNAWSYVSEKGGCTALVLPSRNEGFPMVLLEALSRGIYCIATDCETGPADIINRNNGLLFPVGDDQKLAEIMQNIIDQGNEILPAQADIAASIRPFENSEYCNKVLRALKLM